MREDLGAAAWLSLAPRKVVAISPNPAGGWLLELDCGHMTEWKIAPPIGIATCPQCADELIARLKSSPPPERMHE